MSQSPYFYFMNLYKKSHETIICVDENLKVIYISDSFRRQYEFNLCDDVLTSCFIPAEFSTKIKTAIISQVSLSFNFICIQDDFPKKCFIFPNLIESKPYASILIIDDDNNQLFKDKNNELRHGIEITSKEIFLHINSLISLIRKDSDCSLNELYSNPYFINALKIRKEIEELNTLSRNDLRTKESFLIDINKYIVRRIKLLTELLGKSRVSVTLKLHNSLLVSEIKYDVLDLIMSNVIAFAIKDVKGKANLTICTKLDRLKTLVAVAKDNQECMNIINNFENCIDFNGKNEIASLDRIFKENKCNILTSRASDNSLSVAFTLPGLRHRPDIIREDPYDNTEQLGFLSTFGLGLVQLLDD